MTIVTRVRESLKAFGLARGAIIASTALLLSCSPAHASEHRSQIVFTGKGFALRLDAESGRIAAIDNRLAGETYSVSRDGGIIGTDSGTIDLATLELQLAKRTDTSCEFSADRHGLSISYSYEVQAGRAYFTRTVCITNTTARPILIRGIRDCALEFAAPFRSAAFHDDNMDRNDPMSYTYMERDAPVRYHTSLNVFLRNDAGGLCAGLKYPYFRPDLSNQRMALSYEANYRIAPGETLELPSMFCGVYRKTGYTIRKELNWTPRILSVEQEEMDLGEVRAMQEVMRDHLPMERCPRPGYFIWLNSYWVYDTTLGGEGMTPLDAPRAQSYARLADLVQTSGCIDLMGLAHVWCGWARYLEPCPEIDAVGRDAVFPRNTHIDAVSSHAKAIGLPISSFCEPTALVRGYRTDRADWRVIPHPDSSETLAQKCHANSTYEDWLFRLMCSAIGTCGLSGWAWDHQWVRHPLTCYSPAHGHPTGNCEFTQYRNVTRLISRLRQRYPGLFMEVYWGLKEAGPWALRGLNSMENAYENGAPPPPGCTVADDLRFQHWFNHNYRFIPTYMNMAQMNFRRERNGHLYSILSCLSASTHASLCDWVQGTTDADVDTLFAQMRFWTKWASANLVYLDDRIDLFGMPCREGGIDGTAHCIGDKGYIFAFNPTGGVCYGSVPLTDTIGLTRGTRFAVDEISTQKPSRLGVYNRGDDMVFAIAPRTALLFEIRPSRDSVVRAQIPPDVIVQPSFRP